MNNKIIHHIPSADIRELGDISFVTAIREALERSDEYDVAKWLFVPNRYTEYRYILGTKGTKPVICVGINPSTARPNMLDPTLKSVERIALGNGYDSFLMINVAAQRATSPDDMDYEFNETLHAENMKAFQYVLELAGKPPHIWAAWGTIITKRPYLINCLSDMAAIAACHDAEWLCAGKCSRAGHPHHPLYLKKDERFYSFDITNYLRYIRT